MLGGGGAEVQAAEERRAVRSFLQLLGLAPEVVAQPLGAVAVARDPLADDDVQPCPVDHPADGRLALRQVGPLDVESVAESVAESTVDFPVESVVGPAGSGTGHHASPLSVNSVNILTELTAC
ncbi:hypothetical protein GCM10017559_77320 [Streptosporangium longisporum]|uniref:Uncharacterized protein n=1 Tax=Streptosporangium longisporum TaxID=46187 RepID=A0ABP6LD31_9ACTN